MGKHRLYTKLLKRKVRLTEGKHAGRAGVVVNVYLLRGGIGYTVMMKDGRLLETTGTGIVIEG